MPPILYRAIRLSIPMGCGAFSHNVRLIQHHVPIPGTGELPYDNEPMQWKEYLPVCTDTIAKIRLYCQQLFLPLFHLPFKGPVGGMPTLSRGPVPLDSYRVSQINDLVKNFFWLFWTFFDFFCLAAEWGMAVAGYRLTIIDARYAGRRAVRWGGDVITITIIDMNRNENHFHYY